MEHNLFPFDHRNWKECVSAKDALARMLSASDLRARVVLSSGQHMPRRLGNTSLEKKHPSKLSPHQLSRQTCAMSLQNTLSCDIADSLPHESRKEVVRNTQPASVWYGSRMANCHGDNHLIFSCIIHGFTTQADT